ncbi:hypothetical protein NFJ02_04g114170 [Pycnococcus provasolii]
MAARVVTLLALVAAASAQSLFNYGTTQTTITGAVGVTGANPSLAIDNDFSTAWESVSGAVGEPTMTLDLKEVREISAIKVFFLESLNELNVKVLPNTVIVRAGYTTTDLKTVSLLEGNPEDTMVGDSPKPNGMTAKKTHAIYARYIAITVQNFQGDDQVKPEARFAEIVLEGPSCKACPTGQKFKDGTCACEDCGCARGNAPTFEGKEGIENYGRMDGRAWWSSDYSPCNCKACPITPKMGMGLMFHESRCELKQCEIPPYYKQKSNIICQYDECPPCANPNSDGIIAGLEVTVLDEATNNQRCTCEKCPSCPEGKWSDPTLPTVCNCVDIPPSPPPPPPPPPIGRPPTMRLNSLTIVTGEAINVLLQPSFNANSFKYSGRIVNLVSKLTVTTTTDFLDQRKMILEVATPSSAVNASWSDAVSLDVSNGIDSSSETSFDISITLYALPEFKLEPVTYTITVTRNAAGGASSGGGGAPTLSTVEGTPASEEKLGSAGIAVIVIICILVMIGGSIMLVVLSKQTAARAEAAKELLVDIPTSA